MCGSYAEIQSVIDVLDATVGQYLMAYYWGLELTVKFVVVAFIV